MKNYLVPMWNYKNHEMKEHLALVKAQDKYQAMLIAIGSHNCPSDKNGWSIIIPDEDKWNVDMNYNAYIECPKPEVIFTYMDKNVKIKALNSMEDKYMDIYDYMYWGDYNAKIRELAAKALPEKWSFECKEDYSILKNYLNYTFNKLRAENKVIETNTYCAFDTGLFNKYYLPIYVYGEKYKNPSENTAKWFFKGFKDKYELGAMDILEKFPERADYFSDPSRLVFDWHLDVIINCGHILDDLNTLLLRPSQPDLQLTQLPVTELTDILSPKNKKERILEPSSLVSRSFQDLRWYYYHGYRIKVSVRTQ